ncbi:DUF4174 domain-containing protein [Jannaschia pohangensis]|uniref:DUF4174 domain-containing protein n=1 Tax=Jannaschia pohangensis TaxID=390807 RepID=A0A1I3IL45_9RHOB|nr:DUF4174 domain-containing protein [Jannaschia pohangensis]SFI48694.1 protein of unknown function [Jannaschia pohangensis]
MHALTTLMTTIAFLLPSVAGAEDADIIARWTEDPTQAFAASEVSLDDLQWIARPVVVFANSPRDPAFIEQMEEIVAGVDRLVERDVIIIIDTDPAGQSDLRLQLRPRGFMLVLIGKDGQVNQRKPLPWTVREISRTIDKMPMRQREMREGR